MKKLLALILTLFTAVSASAQITIPNSFSPNTTAQSALVNANFSQLGSLSLNRAGGNITGNITADGGITIDGIDIGATICTTCDPTFDDLTIDTLTAVSATLSGTLAVTGAVTLSSTIEVGSSAANAIDVAGGITAGSGNVAVIGTDGRIPALSSTYFASLSGANLSGILESSIADGSLLARVAANETISGQWNFSNPLRAPDGGQSTPGISFNSDTNTGFYLNSPDVLVAATGGDSHTAWLTNGNFQHTKGVIFTSVLSPSTLASGNNNNYAPTGIGTALVLSVTGNASNSVITGISGGESGRFLIVCDTDAGGTVTIAHENTNSTAGNRFNLGVTIGADPRLNTSSTAADHPGPCMQFIYINSRWTLIGSAPLGS